MSILLYGRSGRASMLEWMPLLAAASYFGWAALSACILEPWLCSRGWDFPIAARASVAVMRAGFLSCAGIGTILGLRAARRKGTPLSWMVFGIGVVINCLLLALIPWVWIGVP